MRSNGLNGRSISGQRRYDSSSIRDGKKDNQDWLAAELSKRSVQDVVDDTGMHEKAVQNIRQRKSKISFDYLVELCRNDKLFATAFAKHVGLILPNQEGFVARINQALLEAQRLHMEGDAE